MTTLHLGVIDIPYTEGSVSTGDVAEILEERYGVMDGFVQLHGEEIADAVAKQLVGMMESIQQGAPAQKGDIDFPEIHAQFAEYLDKDEWQKATGDFIVAAQKGVRHSHKSVTANKKGPRPAFEDTLLYRNSMRAWLST